MLALTLALALGGGPLPAELLGGGRVARLRFFPTLEGELVGATVWLHAPRNQVQILWQRADGGMPKHTEELEFAPTAGVASRVDPRVLHVVGWCDGQVVRERWKLGPGVARERVPVDGALGPVVDVALWPGRTGGAEELWALEWGTGAVYALHADGSRRLRLPGREALTFRSLWIADHHDYGWVVLRRSKPWFGHVIMPAHRGPFAVAYDQDRDGSFDGSFDIPDSRWARHPLNRPGGWRDQG